ncbi:hypothetical protein Tco_0125453, partial [Tanacetum coccineum]
CSLPMCDDAIESKDDIFASCSIAKDTWKCIAWNIPSIIIDNLIEGLNLADRVPLPAASIRFFNVVVQTTHWLLWRFHRNDTTFATKRPNKQVIIDDVKLSSTKKGFY